MIVFDASAVVELLIRSAVGEAILQELAAQDESFLVPHLMEIEVLSALRRLVASERLDRSRGNQLLTDLAALPAERFAHADLLPRIWELRHNFTPYDATYIALAEATNAMLYTCDEKLQKGHRAKVRLFTA